MHTRHAGRSRKERILPKLRSVRKKLSILSPKRHWRRSRVRSAITVYHNWNRTVDDPDHPSLQKDPAVIKYMDRRRMRRYLENLRWRKYVAHQRHAVKHQSPPGDTAH